MNAISAKINPEDKKQFQEKGYWISPKLLTDDQIERLKDAHNRLWSNDFDGDGYPMSGKVRLDPDPLKIRKLDNGWWVNDEIQKAVTDPLMGELAADLMDTDEVRLWHDQVLYKPGANGQDTFLGNVGWHQDFGYWGSSDNSNMITVWIALQDTDLRNGGMSTIVGSHKWGLVPDSNTFFDQNLQTLKDKYTSTGREWIEEPCILKAGQASFHHALTFHGSGPNYSKEPRLSIVAHLMPKGTGYCSKADPHSNVMLLGPRPKNGQLYNNDYFPIVFKR
jgi:ectoine hydroxylase-related dioxygenase (phytanoyl-CoA dioxygenase family)